MAGFKDRLIGKVAKFVEGMKSVSLLSVGTQAPDFEVAAHDGTTVKLSDYRGKKVILWFYPKADTPG
jgi:peroxiredoxin Q/BCP